MNSKVLIIIAIVGILGLAVFNMVISHKTAEVVKADTPAPMTTVTTAPATPSVGLQPKATMDKATSQINQANADANAKMAQVDNAGGGK